MSKTPLASSPAVFTTTLNHRRQEASSANASVDAYLSLSSHIAQLRSQNDAMATSQQSSSLLARSRSTRQTAHTNKPLHVPAASTTRTTPASHHVATLRTETGSSNLSLFLTNLRLLDLDLLSDWPGITAQTFSARDAAQGQKKRVQCVEWALYQLFTIWDPEETRNVGPQLLHLEVCS